MNDSRVEDRPSPGSPSGRAALLRATSALRRLPLRTLAGALPVGYALILGLHHLREARYTDLDPDAITFMQLADRMTLSTLFNGWREPLWPVLLVLPTKLLGIHPTMIRVLGLVGFVLMVAAFQRLVGRLYGRTWGIVAALLLAACPWLVYQSARGLREEAATGLVLLFIMGVIAGVRDRRLVLLAAAAGLIGLLRWDSVLITVPTLVVAAIVARSKIRHALQAAAVFIILVAPTLIAAQLKYGNPLHFSNSVAPVFFRNAEFAGKPGFPTLEEVKADSLAGKQISWFEYFTQVLTPEQSVRRTLDGLTTIPLTGTQCSVFYPACGRLDGHLPTLALASSLSTLIPWLVVVAGGIGSVLLVRRRGTWPIPLALVLSVLTFAPIAKLLDPRLIITALPFLFIGTIECLHASRRRLRGRQLHTRPALPDCHPDSEPSMAQ